MTSAHIFASDACAITLSLCPVKDTDHTLPPICNNSAPGKNDTVSLQVRKAFHDSAEALEALDPWMDKQTRIELQWLFPDRIGVYPAAPINLRNARSGLFGAAVAIFWPQLSAQSGGSSPAKAVETPHFLGRCVSSCPVPRSGFRF